MKIAVDIKAFKNGNTGIARYLRELLDQLQKIDKSNEYILFSSCKTDYKLKNKNWKIISDNWKLPGIFWQQFKLPKLLKKYNSDLLWSPEQICPVFGELGIPIVTTIHDNVSYHFPKTVKFTAHIIFKIIYPKVLVKSTKLITVSKYIKADTIHLFKRIYGINKKTIAIPNGKPEWKTPQNYDFKNRGNYLLFVGNAEPRKNLISLIRALEILEQDNCPVELHLVGPKGWKNKGLDKYIKNSRANKNIKRLGYLSDEELIREYLNCKAFIYPSLYEGFGLPILEAFILDTIVLTSENTAMEEVAGKGAVFFNSQNAKDIANKIKFLYSDNFQSENYKIDMEKQLEKFSWETSALNHLQVFENCMRQY